MTTRVSALGALLIGMCCAIQVHAADTVLERSARSAHSAFSTRMVGNDWDGIRPMLSAMKLPADIAPQAQEAFIAEQKRLGAVGIKLIGEKVSSVEIQQTPGLYVALISVVSRYTHPLSPKGIRTETRVRLAESTDGKTWHFSPLSCPIEAQVKALAR